MSAIIWDKCINALIERGLFFAVAWGFSVWHVYTSGALLGWELDSGDMGFVLVQMTVLYVALHHFVVYWRARSKYYSPLSYRDGVYADVKDARALASWLMLHSRQPKKSENNSALTNYKQEISRGLNLALKLPADISEEALSLFTEILSIAKDAFLEPKLTARTALQNKINLKVAKFLEITNWVLKK